MFWKASLSAEAGAGRLNCVQEGSCPRASWLLLHPYSPVPSCEAKRSLSSETLGSEDGQPFLFPVPYVGAMEGLRRTCHSQDRGGGGWPC